jgi:hypothetical protein
VSIKSKNKSLSLDKTRRLDDRETGCQEKDFVSGRQEDWETGKTGRICEWGTRRLGGKKTGRLRDWKKKDEQFDLFINF